MCRSIHACNQQCLHGLFHIVNSLHIRQTDDAVASGVHQIDTARGWKKADLQLSQYNKYFLSHNYSCNIKIKETNSIYCRLCVRHIIPDLLQKNFLPQIAMDNIQAQSSRIRKLLQNISCIISYRHRRPVWRRSLRSSWIMQFATCVRTANLLCMLIYCIYDDYDPSKTSCSLSSSAFKTFAPVQTA